MAGRQGRRIWIAGVLGVVVVGGLVVGVTRPGRRSAAPAAPVNFDERTPLSVLTPALRDSDARALSALERRVIPKDNAPLTAIPDAESKEWLDVITGLRAGYPQFSGQGRSVALTLATKIFDRFAKDPAPTNWPEVLQPLRELLVAGLVDADMNARVTALTEIGRLWVWIPGNTPEPVTEEALVAWKSGLHGPVVRCLTHKVPQVRAAAVACLGYLPIDDAAAPAIPYLDDMGQGAGIVRSQVLVSFARNPRLLTEDAILKHLYDPEPGVPEMAEFVLKTRGLNQEQISLGRMIFHPKAELRASVIPLLVGRTDIDPVIWLLHLSRDAEESVRASAVEALVSRPTPEVRRRLEEMARDDKSATVRQAASKFVPTDSEKTAALPPLPGSPSLNPKAN
ncbi:HEAT repeat domain-containing protein [Singulisphaera sp. PoT]|uniref:HEAT repeat domain-containing protein n=1 Tax=Singulisphaera sp. PoT TaxID=3411797 RepID=UPI003BF51902